MEDKIPTWINEVAKPLKNVKIDGVTWGTLGPLRKIVAKPKFFIDRNGRPECWTNLTVPNGQEIL